MADKKEMTLEERFADNAKQIGKSYIQKLSGALWIMGTSGAGLGNAIQGHELAALGFFAAAGVVAYIGHHNHKANTELVMENMKIAAKLAAERPNSAFFDLPTNDRK